MEELLTLEEVAGYLRVTEKTVYRLLDKNSIPAIRVGRQWRFEKASVDAWLHQNTKPASMRILVIDDDDLICSLFTAVLKDAGHEVVVAGKADWALELISQGSFDLVFLDLLLPGMDGAELFRHIKAVKPDLPVTIITGYPDSEQMMKALEYGPLGAMKKPFTNADILNAVNNHVRFSRMSR